MPGYRMLMSRGNVAASEDEQVFAPTSPRSGTCGVVMLHGSGNPKEYVDLINQPSSVRLAAALASAGIPCISGDFGGQAWGSETVVSRVDAAWAYLRSLYPTMRSDKVCLIGASMGGAGAAHYVQDNPTKVAAFVGLIPLLDVLAFYAANTGAVANEMSAAWGVANGAALPAHADVAGRASLGASVPTLLGYSTADTTVLPAWVTAYGTAVGAQMVITDTSTGHTDASIGGMPISTVGQFISSHGA